MDLPAVLNKLYPGVAGIGTVNNEISSWPEGLERPTKAQLAQAWREVQQERAEREVVQKRRERYQAETDPMLYDALAKLDLPELKEWKAARDKIKLEIPKPEQAKGDK
jgi:hypothetical protein